MTKIILILAILTIILPNSTTLGTWPGSNEWIHFEDKSIISSYLYFTLTVKHSTATDITGVVAYCQAQCELYFLCNGFKMA